MFKQLACLLLCGVYALSSCVFVHAYGMDMVVYGEEHDGGCAMHHEAIPVELLSDNSTPLDISCMEQCIGTYDDYSYQQVKWEYDNLIANKTDRQSHRYLWHHDHTPTHTPLLSSNGDP